MMCGAVLVIERLGQRSAGPIVWSASASTGNLSPKWRNYFGCRHVVPVPRRKTHGAKQCAAPVITRSNWLPKRFIHPPCGGPPTGCANCFRGKLLRALDDWRHLAQLMFA